MAQHAGSGASTRGIKRTARRGEGSGAGDGQDGALPRDDAVERVDTRRRSRGGGGGSASSGTGTREARQVEHQATRAGSRGTTRGGDAATRGRGRSRRGGRRTGARTAASSEHVDGRIRGRAQGRRSRRDVVAGVANEVVGEVDKITSGSGLLSGSGTAGDRGAGGRGVSETGGLDGLEAQRNFGVAGSLLTGEIRVSDEIEAGHGPDVEPVHLVGRNPLLHKVSKRRGLLTARIARTLRGPPVRVLVLLTSGSVRLVAGAALGEGNVEVRKQRGVNVPQDGGKLSRTLPTAGTGARHHEGEGGEVTG